LYAGPATVDRIIRSVIGPTSRRLVARGTVDRWFFLRYRDPHHHVRWRLQVSASASLGRVRHAVERASARLSQAGVLERLAYDTYHREIERYGGDAGLDIAESLFHVDSDTALDLIAAASAPGESADTRWQATLLSIDRLLADFALDLPARLTVMRRGREAMGRRVYADANVGRQLAKRYRAVRGDLSRLLSGPAADGALASISKVLERRSRLAAPLVARLRTLADQRRLTTPIEELVESCVHMHVNRLVRAEQNLHEVVIYDFLVQLYTEQLARSKRR
jgi:thiopeptide-type bacteriocin biosynthesis protein